MNEPRALGDRSGDLYDSAMGDDVLGGNVQFNYHGLGYDHHSVFGDDRHFSWDSHPEGDIDGVHGWEHTLPQTPW